MTNKNYPLIGAHMSIAQGLVKSLENAKSIGFNTMAIFSSSPRVWHIPKRSSEEINNFLTFQKEANISPIFLHALYLANPSSSDKQLYQKSINALIKEVFFCSRLNIDAIVLHPGSHKGSNLSEGIRRVANAIDIVLNETGSGIFFLLETMSGGKNCVGTRFEHLRDIISFSDYPEQIGICLDTCHIFCSGYDFRTTDTWYSTKYEFTRVLGFEKLKLIHVNDSFYPLAQQRDKHEHLGKGRIGINGFKIILNDPDIRFLPMILETPKDPSGNFDRMNYSVLRKILSQNGMMSTFSDRDSFKD